MLKVAYVVRSDLSSIFSDHLKRLLIKNQPCARPSSACCESVRQLHVVRTARACAVPLLRRFVRFSHVSLRPQSNTNDIGSDEEQSPPERLVVEPTNFEKPIPKDKLNGLLNKLAAQPMLYELEEEYGIDAQMARKVMVSFKKFCSGSEQLPQDLHVIIWDILDDSGHVDDLFPFFLKHARQIYPELECMEDLRKISDLTNPTAWYPEARSKQRKVIYHAGPTNSGKTYHALQRFLSAKSGVYCGPLRLLAAENFKRANASGTPCDLITGEERKYVSDSGEPSSHQACTVEMTNLSQPYEVAIIDEIQMVRDQQRGWAFTRAFLGVCADEIHLCGEEACVDLIRDLTLATGDTFEVRRYNRLTKLKVLKRGVDSYKNIKPGDCIVCFSKHDIFKVTKKLEQLGIETAVIYGTLPPGTKLAQAEKFNDPSHPCKVLVATDAVGMGLNLSIKRVVFHSLAKVGMNSEGEAEMDLIPAHMALQIAGRAGRFLTNFSEGEVTTYKTKDLPLLKKLLESDIEPIKQAGLAPTADQVESFAFHLPKKSLADLVNMFIRICNLDDSKYFMCRMGDFKFLATMIQHVPLEMKVRYTFCCAPIPKKQPFACSMFLKFAKQFSKGVPLTSEWVSCHLGHPFEVPKSIKELEHLENVFDVVDLYLWLSYRFPNMFPDVDQMRAIQSELDGTIQEGVKHIVSLLIDVENLPPESLVFNQDWEEEGKCPSSKELKEMELERLVIKPGEKISDQLLKFGLITPDLLEKLRAEVALKENQGQRNGGKVKQPTKHNPCMGNKNSDKNKK